MTPSLKSLIGTVLLVLLVIVYSVGAVLWASANLAESGAWARLGFFLFSGILWILPAMGIIKWLMLPPRPKQ